jgi:hypothetical protein
MIASNHDGNWIIIFCLFYEFMLCMHSVRSGIDINIESLNFNYNEKW